MVIHDCIIIMYIDVLYSSAASQNRLLFCQGFVKHNSLVVSDVHFQEICFEYPRAIYLINCGSID